MLLKRLKRFFKIIKKDLFSEEAAWLVIIKIIGALIVLSAIALTVVLVLAGIGYLITLIWRTPYINSRTSGNGSSVFDSYTNVGLAFCCLAGVAIYIIYGIVTIIKWLLCKWKESGKEE